MSLENFKRDLESAGGIVNSEIKDNKLYVVYFSPQNYSTKRGQIRQDYPNIVHIETNEPTKEKVELVYEVQ